MFEVGKKVVCIDDAPAEEGEELFGLKKDEIYPLLWVSHNKCCGTMMLDIGIKSREMYMEVCPSCFKPIGTLKPGGTVAISLPSGLRE